MEISRGERAAIRLVRIGVACLSSSLVGVMTGVVMMRTVDLRTGVDVVVAAASLGGVGAIVGGIGDLKRQFHAECRTL